MKMIRYVGLLRKILLYRLALIRRYSFRLRKMRKFGAELTRQPLGCVRYDTVQIVAHTLPIVTLGKRHCRMLPTNYFPDSSRNGGFGQLVLITRRLGRARHARLSTHRVSKRHCGSRTDIPVSLRQLRYNSSGCNSFAGGRLGS